MQTIIISPHSTESSRLNLSDKGIRNECRVGVALRKLKGEGCISDYIKACRQDDLEGVDYWITLVGEKKYKKMPLQVKSSCYYQDIHKKEHPNIPSVAVGDIRFSMIPEKLRSIIFNFKKGKVVHV